MAEMERRRQAITLGTTRQVETAAIEENKRRAIQEETKRLSNVTGAAAATSVITDYVKSFTNQALENVGNIVTDPIGAMTGKFIPAEVRNFYTGNASANVAGIGTNRGMATDTSMAEQTEVLKQIRDRLGGGR